MNNLWCIALLIGRNQDLQSDPCSTNSSRAVGIRLKIASPFMPIIIGKR